MIDQGVYESSCCRRRAVANRKQLSGLILAAVLMLSASASGTQGASLHEFREDGNLTEFYENTQSGRVQFITNGGLGSGRNRVLVFDGANGLRRDSNRLKFTKELLYLLATQPERSRFSSTPATESWMKGVNVSGKALDHVVKYLDSYKMNYWSANADGAALHNLLAKNLRAVNPRTVHGVSVPVHNLQALSIALEALPVITSFAEASIGAALRVAIESDMALYRLELIEAALASAPDPIIGQAIAAVRAELQESDSFFRSFIIELNDRRQEIASRSVRGALMIVAKAAGAKGFFVVGLTFELIVAQLEQHASAQLATMAATVEGRLRQSALGQDTIARCEREHVAAFARYIYFDRTLASVSILPDWMVQMLPASHSSREALEYYAEMRDSYLGAYGSLAEHSCFPDFAGEEHGAGGFDTAERPPAVTGRDGFTYVVTAGRYNEKEDLIAAVKREFGPGAEVADWSHIVANFGDRITRFLDGIGIEQGNHESIMVTRGGAFRYQGGRRQYFFNRFDGRVPGNYMVHDGIAGRTLVLGSWWDGRRRILVRYHGADGVATMPGNRDWKIGDLIPCDVLREKTYIPELSGVYPALLIEHMDVLDRDEANLETPILVVHGEGSANGSFGAVAVTIARTSGDQCKILDRIVYGHEKDNEYREWLESVRRVGRLIEIVTYSAAGNNVYYDNVLKYVSIDGDLKNVKIVDASYVEIDRLAERVIDRRARPMALPMTIHEGGATHEHPIFREHDPNCCPSGGAVIVEYEFKEENGAVLLQPVRYGYRESVERR